MSVRRALSLCLFAVVLLAPSSQRAFAARPSTLLVVLTHGDDHMSIAPLSARYAAEGHAVYYATFTGMQDPTGEEGSSGRNELLCASRALGVRETFVTRGPAGEGHPANAAVARGLIALINKVRPEVIITWGPDGLTGHPRHIMVSNVVTRVFQQRQLLTHKPRKLYYVAYPESRLPDARFPLGEVAGVDGPFGTVSDELITSRVNARRYLKQFREAIACHTLPMAPDNAEWQRKWYDRVAVTLGGTVFLRRVFPAGRIGETDIFE